MTYDPLNAFNKFKKLSDDTTNALHTEQIQYIRQHKNDLLSLIENSRTPNIQDSSSDDIGLITSEEYISHPVRHKQHINYFKYKRQKKSRYPYPGLHRQEIANKIDKESVILKVNGKQVKISLKTKEEKNDGVLKVDNGVLKVDNGIVKKNYVIDSEEIPAKF